MIGAKGRKSEQLNYRAAFAYLISGLLVYFIAGLLLLAKLEVIPLATLYMLLTGLGFILILTGGTLISRIIKSKLADDIFNKEGESFPQEERLLQNKYSF